MGTALQRVYGTFLIIILCLSTLLYGRIVRIEYERVKVFSRFGFQKHGIILLISSGFLVRYTHTSDIYGQLHYVS